MKKDMFTKLFCLILSFIMLSNISCVPGNPNTPTVIKNNKSAGNFGFNLKNTKASCLIKDIPSQYLSLAGTIKISKRSYSVIDNVGFSLDKLANTIAISFGVQTNLETHIGFSILGSIEASRLRKGGSAVAFNSQSAFIYMGSGSYNPCVASFPAANIGGSVSLGGDDIVRIKVNGFTSSAGINVLRVCDLRPIKVEAFTLVGSTPGTYEDISVAYVTKEDGTSGFEVTPSSLDSPWTLKITPPDKSHNCSGNLNFAPVSKTGTYFYPFGLSTTDKDGEPLFDGAYKADVGYDECDSEKASSTVILTAADSSSLHLKLEPEVIHLGETQDNSTRISLSNNTKHEKWSYIIKKGNSQVGGNGPCLAASIVETWGPNTGNTFDALGTYHVIAKTDSNKTAEGDFTVEIGGGGGNSPQGPTIINGTGSGGGTSPSPSSSPTPSNPGSTPTPSNPGPTPTSSSGPTQTPTPNPSPSGSPDPNPETLTGFTAPFIEDDLGYDSPDIGLNETSGLFLASLNNPQQIDIGGYEEQRKILEKTLERNTNYQRAVELYEQAIQDPAYEKTIQKLSRGPIPRPVVESIVRTSMIRFIIAFGVGVSLLTIKETFFPSSVSSSDPYIQVTAKLKTGKFILGGTVFFPKLFNSESQNESIGSFGGRIVLYKISGEGNNEVTSKNIPVYSWPVIISGYTVIPTIKWDGITFEGDHLEKGLYRLAIVQVEKPTLPEGKTIKIDPKVLVDVLVEEDYDGCDEKDFDPIYGRTISKRVVNCRICYKDYESYKAGIHRPDSELLKSNHEISNQARIKAIYNNTEGYSNGERRVFGFGTFKFNNIQTTVLSLNRNTNILDDNFAPPIDENNRFFPINEIQRQPPDDGTVDAEVRLMEHIAKNYYANQTHPQKISVQVFADRETCYSCVDFLERVVPQYTNGFITANFIPQGIFFRGERIPTFKNPSNPEDENYLFYSNLRCK